MKKILSLLIACGMLLSSGLCSAQTAGAADKVIYVAQNGNDAGSGSIDSPFATAARAMEEVRKLNKDMDSDITVYFREGTYRPEDTLRFTEEDGGTNGYYVNYASYPGETAVISGGIPVTGWNKQDKLWYADIEGVDRVGQLYVNDRRAQRARSTEVIDIKEFFKLNESNWRYDGIVIDDAKYADYKNPEDIQLHFGGRGWKSYLLNVTDSHKEGQTTRLELLRYPFNRTTATSGEANWYPILECHTFWLENAFEELDTEGEFYYNRPEKRLYYMPRADEDMKTAQVELAVMDKLIDICGTDANSKVNNIRFDSLTLAHCGWSRSLRVGHVGDQAQDMLNDDSEPGTTLGYTQVPGNIHISYAKNVAFTNNIIKDMGAVGIALFAGVQNCKIEGNVFKDFGDGAVTIGSLDGAFEDKYVYSGKNIAAGKPVTASSYINLYYLPTKALDNNDAWGWSPEGLGPHWWQVDLGEPMEIDRVEVDDRKDADQPGIRSGFEVVGSNDPTFDTYTVIGVQTSEYPRLGTAVIRSRTDEKFRYVRIRKNNVDYLYLNNVRIINESMDYAPSYEVCKNNLIKNNVITRIGLLNYGAPAITAYWTRGTNITHNHIYDVPYSGVSLGWGWSTNPTSVISRDNRVTYNHIEKIQQICYDAGAVYVMAQNPNSIIAGNYANDGYNPGVAYYQDTGSKGFTLKDNVSERFAINFHLAYLEAGYAKWDNNFTSVSESDICPTTTSSWEEPMYFIPGAYPTEAIEIMQFAGLEPGYEHLLEKTGINYWPVPRQQMYNGIRTDYFNTGMSKKKIMSDCIGCNIEDSELWLGIAEPGYEPGQYPPEEIELLRKVTEETQKYYDETLEYVNVTGEEMDRDELVRRKLILLDAQERFISSRIRLTMSEAISLAEKNLAEEVCGEEIGMVGEKQYKRLEKALSEAKSNPDGKYALEYLEQSIYELEDSRLVMKIKSAKIDNQLGAAEIDNENRTIQFNVAYTADITKLAAEIKANDELTVTPDSSQVQDFTNPVTYRISTKSGLSSSDWTVYVKSEEITESDTVYKLQQDIDNRDGWYEFGDYNCNNYFGRRFGDIETEFDMQINNAVVNDWPCLVFRSQKYDMTFDAALNDAYAFVFYPDNIEMHRFNKGVRTQFYGPVPGVTTIFGESLKTEAFKFGKKNKIKLTTRNEDGGVRIILNINGEEVINVLDNYEGAITAPGYIGTVSPNTPVILGE